MTLIEILSQAGYQVKQKEGRFGLEIETEALSHKDYPKGFLTPNGADQEGHSLYLLPSKDWSAVTDGSLRNFGIEFIFKEPLSYGRTMEALDEFGSFPPKFLKNPPSTSVHVHMNFGGETPLVLATFLTTWTIVENLLLEFSGPTRRSSVFAAGIRTADDQVSTIVKMIRGLELGTPQSLVLSQHHVKYASLNLGNLGKLQSLESRSFRGTTDVEEIKTWVSILDRLMDFCKTPGLTPRHVLKAYVESPSGLISDIFGPYSDLLKCEDYLFMLERNERYALEIVSSVSNWETFGMVFEKPKKTFRKKAVAQLEEYQALIDPSIWITPTPISLQTLTGAEADLYVGDDDV